MNNWIKKVTVQQWILNIFTFFIAVVLGISIGIFVAGIQNETELIASEQWGGAVPMKIYTVFDKDTGVYYAVTEKGGICVMQTMSGETKLVDQGDGAVIHLNQGEQKNDR